MRGGQANADDVGAKKFLGANSRQAESNVQPDFVGLRDAVQRFPRHHGNHHQQRADDADERGLSHLAQEKTGVGRVRVVSGAVQRPLIHGHDEIQHGEKCAQREAAAPLEQSRRPSEMIT